MSTKEAAKIIGMSVSFLNQDRYYSKATGTAPKVPFIRLGRTIKYDRVMLADVMAENMVVAS